MAAASPIPTSNTLVLTPSTFVKVKETVTIITTTTSDQSFKSSSLEKFVASTLARLAKTIQDASGSGEDPFYLQEKLKEAVQSTAALAEENIPHEQKSRVINVRERINELLLNVTEDIRNSPIFRTPTPKPKKTPAQRIADHNQKAIDAIPLQKSVGLPLQYYPKTPAEKKNYGTKIKLIEPSRGFVYPDQISLSKSQLPTSEVVLAKAMGNREYMEDFSMSSSMFFLGKERIFEAEVACVCDGHGGKEPAKFVVENLIPTLQKQLVSRLSIPEIRDPTQDDIFYALKETVKILHKQIGKLGYEGGTTAVIAFKFQNKLYTANIGDSRAFINRGGKVIPMSIDQKPYGIRQKHIEGGTQFNEYAHQIIDKKNLDLVRHKKDAEEELNEFEKALEEIDESMEQEVFEGKKMVVSYLYTEEGIDRLRLGITDVHHLDMTRSIGDSVFNAILIRSPEIFCQDIFPGDQVVLHSDGVCTDPQAIIDIIEKEKQAGDPLQDTVVRLVQASIPEGDNVTLMVMTCKGPKSDKTE